MLRNLRSRRRPRYGAHLCAGLCALLLLISLSLLHNRLSISSKPHRRRPPIHLLLPPSNPLLSDSDDDSASAAVSSSDKIDELDIIDDTSNDDEDADLEDSSYSSSSSARFFFDHVAGVIRSSLGKSPIDEWDFDYVGFNDVVWESEGRVKEAFASDDVPVDEEIRIKMAQVVTVEDAFLLKVGKRVSPLRERWGDWLEKKGDFLRKDRMFRSSMEILNPLNTPLLQDPDLVGASGLTRGDKVVHKLILNELKTKKPLEASTGRSTGKMKMPERRALDENLKNRYQTRRRSKSNGVKNLSSTSSVEKVNDGSQQAVNLKIGDSESQQNVNEFSGHIYADGNNRWGYYPGLDPLLSFSDFMDAFFLKGKCDIRVFMIWNSPPWMFTVRHQRSLESLFAQHRDACAVFFSETVELDFFRDSFVKDGFKVAAAMPNLDELLKDTPAHVFASVWFKWKKTQFYSTHYSELVRLAALYKYGGIYLDFDIIVLKPLLSSLNNSVGLEDKKSAGSSLNGAVMAFRRHSPFMTECLKEFYSTYDDTRLRWNGADLLTRVAKKFYSEISKSIAQQELKVQPSFVFFPISSENITRYFVAPGTESEKVQQDVLFRKILDESTAVHYWDSLTAALIPEPGSLVSRLINHPCIHCSEVL